MGAQRLPLFLLLLNVSPQIDRGVDHEHEGGGIEMLIVIFSTSNLHSLLITCNRPTTRIVYRRRLTDQRAYDRPRQTKHTARIIVHVYILQGSELQR